MDKTLQTTVWHCLPREFRKEVKRMWSVEVDCATKYKSELHKHRVGLLYELFGDNLASDADGEEMLTISAKRVQQNYAEKMKSKGNHTATQHDKDMATGWCNALRFLFGSKCLPDESESPILSKVENIGKDCKAEPKFIVGNEVVFEESVHIVVGVLPNLRLYYLSGCEDAVAESDLKPYTGPLSQNPTENCDNENVISSTETCTNVCPSPHPSQEESDRDLCDKLIQRGFKNHNRLHIASMILAGLLASGKDKYPIKRALELADALIAESEKGGKQ